MIGSDTSTYHLKNCLTFRNKFCMKVLKTPSCWAFRGDTTGCPHRFKYTESVRVRRCGAVVLFMTLKISKYKNHFFFI